MNNSLQKEIELAEDLKDKLDAIEGKKSKRTRKTKTDQKVTTPYDKIVDESFIPKLDSTKKKVEEIEKSSLSENESNYPDPVKHKHISFIKSGFRILAGATLFFGEFAIAGVLFIVAELLGVYEEMV